jgi:hypothetical protein
MARSQYIYVVYRWDNINAEAGALVAAFTVKHELVTWLRRELSNAPWNSLGVARVRDGLNHGDETPVPVDIAGLIGETW